MHIVNFDEFELDLKQFTLKRRGKPLEIGPRSLDLLVCLIENRDRVVDHEFLRREVWKSAALSPAAIPTGVRELRRLLGDDARKPRFIESTRGRGYRFSGSIRTVAEGGNRLKQPLAELPFVGRSFELSAIRKTIRATVTQAIGRIVLIRGEAGIGKSRLLSEALKASAPSIPRFGVRGSSAEGTPAFWPWTQIVQEAIAVDPKQDSALLRNAQALAGAFPEIQRPANAEFHQAPKLDRFSILSQWARTIRSISPAKPLILAFEDIHRADFDSLLLLSWLADELSSDPVIILATHRPPSVLDETAEVLSDIATLENCVTIDIPPLTQDDISSLLDPLVVDRPSLSQALHTRTSGNPFYVTHLIRYLDSHTNFESPEALIAALPSNGREIVSNQLSDLHVKTREALAVASVAGIRFSIKTAAAALGVEVADLISSLEPARRAWLIQDDGTDYVFCHALLREALYQTLEGGRRRQTHLDLANILIKQPNSASSSSQISDHLIQALPLGDASQARRFSLLAGRESATRFAYAESQTHFRRALRLTEADTEHDDAELCRVTLEYASAQLYAGNRAEARESLLAAARLARSCGSPDLLARCALELAPDYLSIIVGAYDLTLVNLLREALSATPPNNIALKAKLLARLSQAIQWSEDPTCHADMTLEALDLARESRNHEALSAALSARAELLRGPAGARERIGVLAELYDASRTDANVAERLLQKTQLITALLEVGNLQRLDAENEECREIANQTGLPHFMWHAESTDSMRDLMKGNLAASDRQSKRFSEVQRLTHDQNVTQEFAAQQIYRQVELDRSREVLPFVTEFAYQQDSVLTWSAALCWMQWDAGLFSEARATLSRLGHSGIEVQSRETGGGIGIAGLAEVTAHLGDHAEREQLYRILSPIKEHCASAGYGWLYFGSFARCSALLASSLDQHDEAVSDARLAVREETKRRSSLWIGYALVDLAEVLCRAKAPQQKIAEALSDARIALRDCTSPRLSRRYRSTLERVDHNAA